MNREPGWYRDPYFRNRERYWTGNAWSDQTRLIGESTAPALPTSAATSAGPAQSTGSDAAPTQPTHPPADTAAAMLDPTEAAQAAPTGGAPSPQSAGAAGASTPPSGSGTAAPGQARPIPVGVIGASGSPTTPKGSKAPGGSDRRRGLVVALVAVGVLIVAGVGYLLVGGSSGSGGTGNSGNSGNTGNSGGGGTASAAGVSAALAKTLRKGTVDAAVTVKVSSGGSSSSSQQILSGTGGFNLKEETGTMSLNVSGGTAGESNTQLVFVGQTVYVNIGPSLSTLIPGKTWISATTAELASASSGVSPGISSFAQWLGNPAALVQQLNGSHFTSLGSSTFNHASVQGYTVKLSPGPASASTSAGAHAGETLYVTSKQLVSGVVIPVVVSSNGQSFHESITIVFTRYGKPVNITPPPAAEVATLAQYQAALGQSGQTPGVHPGSILGTPPGVSPVGGAGSG